MNHRTRKSKKTIPVPCGWSLPKYRLGQMVKQGLIIGVEYYPPEADISYGRKGEWFYCVIENLESEDIAVCSETEIELLDQNELQTLVKDEIEFHQYRITALTEQLEMNGESNGHTKEFNCYPQKLDIA